MSIALRAADWLELVIMLFQVLGVVSLACCRLIDGERLARCARVVFFLTLFGLALAGAVVAHQDSEFGLFAGGTMTVLLIGMTAGGGPSRSLASDQAVESPALG